MMNALAINIAEEILFAAKIPHNNRENETKKEFALQIYREGIVSFANAHNLSDLSKIEFHLLLGERKIPRQYDEKDYKKDLENLESWSKQK